MVHEGLRKLLNMIYVDVITNSMPKCSSLRQLSFQALCFFSVYLLPLFASCLDPLESGIVSGRRSRQINNPQADLKFTRTTTSKNADLAKKHLVDGA